jgi:hypothetical protein
MAAAVRVRGDYEAAQIRVLAKRSENAAQTRRLLVSSVLRFSLIVGFENRNYALDKVNGAPYLIG